MAVIEKKIWPDMFEKDRKCPVDFRLADFDVNEGDVIRFREWDPETKQYTGRSYERTVGTMTKNESPTRYWTKEQLQRHGMYIFVWKD